MGVVSSEYHDKWVWSAVNIMSNGCGQQIQLIVTGVLGAGWASSDNTSTKKGGDKVTHSRSPLSCSEE